jgi:hypothetical protein
MRESLVNVARAQYIWAKDRMNCARIEYPFSPSASGAEARKRHTANVGVENFTRGFKRRLWSG